MAAENQTNNIKKEPKEPNYSGYTGDLTIAEKILLQRVITKKLLLQRVKPFVPLRHIKYGAFELQRERETPLVQQQISNDI